MAPPQATYEDEYDSYLLQAAAKLWRDEPEGDVLAYLIEVEQKEMGLGENPSAGHRAGVTVAALKGYLDELRGRA